MKNALLFGLVILMVLTACSANRQKLSPQANLNLKSANVYFTQKDSETSLRRALDLYEKVLLDNPEHVYALKRSADLHLFFATAIEPKKLEKDGAVEYVNMNYAQEVIDHLKITFNRYGEVVRVMDTFEKLNDDEKFLRRDAVRKKESSWVRMYKIGQLLLEQKDYTKAEETFLYVQQLDETRQEPLRALVALYQETKDAEKSKLYLDKILAVSPDDPDMMRLMGAYYYNNKQYEQAIPYFQNVLTQAPLDTNNMLLLSSAYTELKNYQAAQDLLVRVLRFEPENLDVLLSARDLARALENVEDEKTYMKRVVDLSPTIQNLEEYCFRMIALNDLENLMPYAEMWFEKDPQNKTAVSTCILIANRTGRTDLEKRYSDIYRRLP
ncbi:MAG: tetratricopeptide repeat protein [Candidatus Cloacimonadaceae bacterium]